ncbi:hypothetical protein OHR86_00030 [Streptomyces sp. NBC_00441]|uniref:hypothetical protein n=1 Tax=Streptomyces sp. NBC_00441 TaxID=2975742 RepID=UPI002E2E70C5|nr:hypothetical protein [Streptomyces sp. NBC_00441]
MTTTPTPAPSDTALEAAEETVTVTVELTVTEDVTYEFRSEVEVPAEIATDPDELHDYLTENEELWLDDLNPVGGVLYINERHLDQAALVLTA